MKKFGHYEVTAELGRGGMGVVYKGWDPSLNRKVAIKALGEHLLNDEDLKERFTREAKATAALNDPNVIQIYFKSILRYQLTCYTTEYFIQFNFSQLTIFSKYFNLSFLCPIYLYTFSILTIN